MTFIKKIINKSYGFRMKVSKLTGLGISKLMNHKKIKAPVSFYNLKAITNNGEIINFETLKGKKILLVNLASECGFTPQYKELEKLYKQNDLSFWVFRLMILVGRNPGPMKK